jgi:hypothetical protein
VRIIPVTCFIISLISLCAINSQAQVKKDSVEKEKKKSITKRAFKEGMKFISTTPKDTVKSEKSINPYVQYTGKIIRNINIEHIGFEKSIYDTTKRVKKSVTKLANFLHVNTREKTLRQHLFLRKNTPLNPYKLADNERYLRDRDFIVDSRIVVIPIEGSDSVDLLVMTRDVFSLGGRAGGSPSAPEFGVYDANVAGRAQRVEFNAIVDPERDPKFGYSFLYRKSSIFGSLANLELAYSQLDDARSYGKETEYSVAARINRPLVSPYARWAGGLEVSNNWSKNVYSKSDTSFLKYRYTIFDTWIGHNFGINRDISNRNRQFLAVRYFNGNYLDQPEQPEYEEARKYNNVVGALAEFTFYRQNYYKTRYVFGFGRTEDIPYGISLGFTGGYIKELSVERPYSAVKFAYGQASRKGNFYRFNFLTGGYGARGALEDVVVQAGAAYFTRLLNMNRYKMRSLASATYTQMFNQTVSDWLDISKKEIPGFKIDSLDADIRFNTHLETALYTPWSILGFRFAPFAAIDMVMANCADCDEQNQLFWGLSSGFRTRNESLIFGTMELKITYIPKDGNGESKFVIGFKQNLRIKNTGTFVRAPGLVKYN